MNKENTVKLLRECDAGVKMGISSIKDVEDHVKSEKLAELLCDSKREHEKLDSEIRELLSKYGGEEKEPNIMAKGMSKIKTGMKLANENSDNVIADLITDGCNMGVKSLHRYLNEYSDAANDAKDITKRLVNIEERLIVDIRGYL